MTDPEPQSILYLKFPFVKTALEPETRMKRDRLWKWMGIIFYIVLSSFLLSVNLLYAQPEVRLPIELCQSSLTSEALQACNAYAACLDATIPPVFHGKRLYAGETLAYLSPEGECAAQYEAQMLSQCRQPVCESQTLINMAVVAAAVDYAYERAGTDAFQSTFASVLNAYGDWAYQDAAEMLATLFREYPHRYLAYGMALAYEAAGMSDEALSSYTQALQVQYFTPLVYYSRGWYFLSLNQPDLADRDFYTFSSLTEGVDTLSGLFVPQNALAEAFLTSDPWIIYPVIAYGSSPGGDQILDLLQTSEYQVDFLWLDGDETLAVRHLIENEMLFYQPVPEILFLHCQSDQCSLALSLQQTFPGLNPGGTFIEINFDGAYAEITVTSEGSESGLWDQSVILPMGAADPRPHVPCAQGALPRLKVGDEVYPQSEWNPVTVYAEPSIGSEMVIELTGRDWQTMIITGSFVCGEDGNWWPVLLSDDQHGWVLEATNGYYFLTTSDLRGTRAAIEDILQVPPATDE